MTASDFFFSIQLKVEAPRDVESTVSLNLPIGRQHSHILGLYKIRSKRANVTLSVYNVLFLILFLPVLNPNKRAEQLIFSPLKLVFILFYFKNGKKTIQKYNFFLLSRR